MNSNKIIVTITASVIFTAVLLGAFSYFIDDELFAGGSWIGPAREPWQFKVILTAIYGAVIGAVAGVIICSLNFNAAIGTGFGLLLNLLSIGILVFILGSDWSNGMTKISYASIVIGLINGAIISSMNSSQKNLE